MFDEKIISVIIIIHASFGSIALLFGLFSILSKKGNKAHKKTGLVFYYSMLCSTFISLLISVLPKHENPFLFSIGVFSLYLVISGKRALKFKNKNSDLRFDRIIAFIMIITGVFMVLIEPIFNQKINIVLTVFGILGCVLAIKDLMSFKDKVKLNQNWLKLHISKILGGYISSVTAFMVVNQFLPNLFNWFLPTILGTAYIIYWNKKIKTRNTF